MFLQLDSVYLAINQSITYLSIYLIHLSAKLSSVSCHLSVVYQSSIATQLSIQTSVLSRLSIISYLSNNHLSAIDLSITYLSSIYRLPPHHVSIELSGNLPTHHLYPITYHIPSIVYTSVNRLSTYIYITLPSSDHSATTYIPNLPSDPLSSQFTLIVKNRN